MSSTNNHVKVWYDPKLKGYSIYDKNGNLIGGVEDATVEVNDNWSRSMEPRNREPYATVNISVVCEIVNEEPKPISETVAPMEKLSEFVDT